MMNIPALMACLLAASAAAASAQVAPTPTAADPLQAQAVVPPAAALSPLAHYRRHSPVVMQPGAWRAANDTVSRVGGWRTYAREAQTPAAGTSTSTSTGTGTGASTSTGPGAVAPATPAVPAVPAHKH